ncbi:hypothetical protein BJ322DRAFT_1025645 [Thelephora terrestris]|uniref:Uncharacterized protein n=1 Tax=Thelephora terrestris TaxID=56493 RepID=A0A9P6L170_9AGAM|nr:hypothetical protein BJ322DRAFT_1025645 [Thelephora terrestris]
MFAKSAVFFIALAAFVNAAPVTDYRVPIELGPGPVKIQPFPDTSSKREPSSNLAANLDFGILFKRASVDVDLGFNDDVGIALPGVKRQGFDSLATQISSLLNQLSQSQGEVSKEQGHGSKRGLDANEPVADPASAVVSLGSDGHVSVALPGFKRQDLDSLTNQISNLFNDQFSQGQGQWEASDGQGYGPE